MRERCRAFIVADASMPSNRILFINAGAYYCLGRNHGFVSAEAW